MARAGKQHPLNSKQHRSIIDIVSLTRSAEKQNG
jgi:hypothetical protein